MSFLHSITKTPSENFKENIQEHIDNIKAMSFDNKVLGKKSEILNKIENSDELLFNYDERALELHSSLQSYLNFLEDISKDTKNAKQKEEIFKLAKDISKIQVHLTTGINVIAHEIEDKAKELF